MSAAIAETEVEYGVRFTTASGQFVKDAWPDSDGDVTLLDGPWVFGATEGKLRRAVADYNGRTPAKPHVAALIERTLTRSAPRLVPAPPTPLPTTPGSLVKATVGGRSGVLLVLTDDGDDIPWRGVVADPGGEWHSPAALSDVTVVHDHGAVK